MTLQADISVLNNRMVKAESDRDTWRATGREEKYLEAYFLVEALERQLVLRLRQETPRSST